MLVPVHSEIWDKLPGGASPRMGNFRVSACTELACRPLGQGTVPNSVEKLQVPTSCVSFSSVKAVSITAHTVPGPSLAAEALVSLESTCAILRLFKRDMNLQSARVFRNLHGACCVCTKLIRLPNSWPTPVDPST